MTKCLLFLLFNVLISLFVFIYFFNLLSMSVYIFLGLASWLTRLL